MFGCAYIDMLILAHYFSSNVIGHINQPVQKILRISTYALYNELYLRHERGKIIHRIQM